MKSFIKKETVFLHIKVYENKFIITGLDDGKEIICLSKKVFSSQRLLIADFDSAVNCLKNGFKELTKGSDFFKPQLNILLQPMKYVDDISLVEKQLLKEVVLESGYKFYKPNVKIYAKGDDLSNEQALDFLVASA